MTRPKITHSSAYDYENVVKRLKKAVHKHHRPGPTGPASMRWNRASVRQGAVAPTRPSLWARATGWLREESKQLTVAALVLLGFGGWMVSSASALFTQRAEAQLAGACHENQLAHAGASYCFDERRFVHTLNADRTTTKAAIDWRVNESAHRVAEAAAAREVREARERAAQ